MDATTLPLWWVTTMTPPGVTSAMLNCAPHVRQCQVLGRAKSRAAFARALIAAGIERGSAASVSNYVRNYGGDTHNTEDLATITDERLYLRTAHARPGDPYVAYPLTDQA